MTDVSGRLQPRCSRCRQPCGERGQLQKDGSVLCRACAAPPPPAFDRSRDPATVRAADGRIAYRIYADVTRNPGAYLETYGLSVWAVWLLQRGGLDDWAERAPQTSDFVDEESRQIALRLAMNKKKGGQHDDRL